MTTFLQAGDQVVGEGWGDPFGRVGESDEAVLVDHEEPGAEAGLFAEQPGGLEAEPPGVLGSIRDALGAGMWGVAIRAAVALGERDENTLTNIVFYARHPELGGRAIRPDERALASEWLQLRDELVRPLLLGAGAVGPGPRAPAVPPRTHTLGAGQRLTTEKVRTAWAGSRCAESEMVPLVLFGHRTRVHRLAVAAYQALEHALQSTGYVGASAGCFNCRPIAGTDKWSLHSYGLAVDIDPNCNPHRRGQRTDARFSSSASQRERCGDVQRNTADTNFTPQQIAAVEAITTVDGLRVFAWGGRWTRSPDSMHFQIDVTPDELRRGIALDFVPAVRPAAAPTPMSPAAATPGAGIGALGTLVLEAPGFMRFVYRFTPADALWTAKLIRLEAGGREDLENAAVLWAMFNRYAFFTHQLRQFATFTAFIRAYSTTLQPVLLNREAAARHMNSAQFVRSGGYYPGTTIPRGQLRRHLDVQAQPWSAVDPTARAVTLRALRGAFANPGIGNATEFASTRIYWQQHHRTTRNPPPDEWRRFTEAFAARKRWRWIGDIAGLDQMRNAFFLDLRLAQVPPGATRILPP